MVIAAWRLTRISRHWERIGVGIVYLVLAAIVVIWDLGPARRLFHDGFRTSAGDLVHDPSPNGREH